MLNVRTCTLLAAGSRLTKFWSMGCSCRHGRQNVAQTWTTVTLPRRSPERQIRPFKSRASNCGIGLEKIRASDAAAEGAMAMNGDWFVVGSCAKASTKDTHAHDKV